MEIAGLENSVPVRMIYVDDKSEVLFKSLAHAARNTRNRDVIFRIVKDK